MGNLSHKQSNTKLQDKIKVSHFIDFFLKLVIYCQFKIESFKCSTIEEWTVRNLLCMINQ